MAAALLGFAEQWATDHGLPSIALTAFTTNRRALRLYGRAGYTPVLVTLTKSLPGPPPT